MKMKHIFLLVFLFCTSFCFAQNKLFDKYADMDHVTSVSISKTMFDMMPDVETGGLKMMNLKGKIESLQILTTENMDLKKNIQKDFTKFMGTDYEELMRVKSDETKATFYVKKKGDQVSQLIMLADTDSSFSVIQLLGNFTIQDIQNIANDMPK